MKLVWSLPVRGAAAAPTRGDLVRARALVAALRADGHEVVVVEGDASAGARAGVTTYRSVVRRLLPRFPALVLRDAGRVLHGLLHGRRLAAAAKRERADAIVETQVHLAGSGALAARLTGLPLVLDDGSPSMEERILGSALPGLAHRVLLHQVRAARALTVSSTRIRDLLVDEGVPTETMHVVPNGVDLSLHGSSDRDEGRRVLGLPNDRTVAAFVGSFQPWHSVDLLVEALRHLEWPSVHLLLIGEGPGRSPVLRKLADYGLGSRVTAPGALRGPALAQALAAADIGVLPGSNDYGQPMKLLDYAAAGLAMAAPDLAPVREVVEPERTALLFAPGDAGSLARALAHLEADPDLRSRLGGRARQEVAAPAAWSSRARTLLSLATDTAGASAPLAAGPARLQEVG